MRETLSRSMITKSFSEYLVKTSTQKSTLGSIDFGRGKGSWVSADELGGKAPIANTIAIINTAIAFALRLIDNFPNNAVSPCAKSPSRAFPSSAHCDQRGCPQGHRP